VRGPLRPSFCAAVLTGSPYVPPVLVEMLRRNGPAAAEGEEGATIVGRPLGLPQVTHISPQRTMPQRCTPKFGSTDL
jgi:hypothetical protein